MWCVLWKQALHEDATVLETRGGRRKLWLHVIALLEVHEVRRRTKGLFTDAQLVEVCQNPCSLERPHQSAGAEKRRRQATRAVGDSCHFGGVSPPPPELSGAFAIVRSYYYDMTIR